MWSGRSITGAVLVLLWLVLVAFSYHYLQLCFQAGTTSGGAMGSDGCDAVEWIYLVGVGLGALTVLWLRTPLRQFFGANSRTP